MTKEKIIELIREEREDAQNEHDKSEKLFPSSYGHGVDYGRFMMCSQLLEEITGEENLW